MHPLGDRLHAAIDALGAAVLFQDEHRPDGLEPRRRLRRQFGRGHRARGRLIGRLRRVVRVEPERLPPAAVLVREARVFPGHDPGLDAHPLQRLGGE